MDRTGGQLPAVLAVVAVGTLVLVRIAMAWPAGLARSAARWTAPRLAQILAFLGGVVLTVDAVTTRPRPQDFPTYELGGGLALVVVAVMLPRLRRVKGGSFEVELEPDGHSVDVAFQTAREMGAGRPSVGEGEGVEVARQVAGYQAIQRLLAPGGLGTEWIGSDVELRLYIFDADLDRLMPVVEPGQTAPASRGWRRGQGVTGAAFVTGRFHLAMGSSAHDPTHGLTPEQQDRYRDVTAVAATPVLNASRRVIAVVSAASRDPGTRLGEEESRDLLLVLSVLSARILVDLLKWYADE